jgi:hypothetical protein
MDEVETGVVGYVAEETPPPFGEWVSKQFGIPVAVSPFCPPGRLMLVDHAALHNFAVLEALGQEPLKTNQEKLEEISKAVKRMVESTEYSGRFGLVYKVRALDPVEKLRLAAEKRKSSGHDIYCDWVRGGPNPPPCSCGHDQLCEALEQFD